MANSFHLNRTTDSPLFLFTYFKSIRYIQCATRVWKHSYNSKTKILLKSCLILIRNYQFFKCKWYTPYVEALFNRSVNLHQLLYNVSYNLFYSFPRHTHFLEQVVKINHNPVNLFNKIKKELQLIDVQNVDNLLLGSTPTCFQLLYVLMYTDFNPSGFFCSSSARNNVV